MSTNNRLFNVQDADLLVHGDVVAATLPQDLEDFKIFDSTIQETYPQALKQAVGEIKAIRTDNVVIDEMAELTQYVNNTLAQCNTTFKTVRFFVRKAFKSNPAIQNQFGLNDVEKVRYNVNRMIVFMQDLEVSIARYREQLIEAGCSPVVLDEIPALGDKLNSDNLKQEQFKKERGVITQDRVQKLNALHKLLTPISEIAHIIYADNEAKLSIYALPKPKSSTNSPDDLLFS